MPQINLLPWREDLRKERNKEFGISSAIAVLLMGAVWFAVHTHFEQRIEFQGQRNSLLESEIAKLNAKIKQIKQLDAEKQRLLARMEIIQRLQSSRPEVVHLFDELVTTLPEGVYYTSVAQKGRSLNIQGLAQSNARVSTLMRQLDASPYLINPRLVEIVAQVQNAGARGGDVRVSRFQLNVSQEKQNKKKGEE